MTAPVRSSLPGKLRRFRVELGLSQGEVAADLGVPRSAVTQMENGHRSISTHELVRLSNLLGVPLADLLSQEDETRQSDPVLALLRLAPSLRSRQEVQEEIRRCFDLCREGVALEKLLGRPTQPALPHYSMMEPRNTIEAVEQGEHIAAEERRRLGLGVAPIANLSEVLSRNGLWVAAERLPDEISGIFLSHPAVGLALIVNRDHGAGRQRFSLAHEYAHALADRSLTVAVSSRSNALELREKRANAFAAGFLMPEAGVAELLGGLDKLQSRAPLVYSPATDQASGVEGSGAKASERLSSRDAALASRLFGVSYQAAIFRLKSLRFLEPGEAQTLLDQQSAARRFLALLGRPEEAKGLESEELRERIGYLGIEAYALGEISRGRLLELAMKLRLDGELLLDLAADARAELERPPTAEAE